jgi:cytidine deaminase
MVFGIDTDKFAIHAGANIDPEHAWQLKEAQYRNCAEKQAFLSAALEGLSLDNLDYIFVYRKPESSRKYNPEMLTPCIDCYSKFVLPLMANKGQLAIVSKFSCGDEFLVDTKHNRECHTDILSGENNIILFRANCLKILKIEARLGSHIKT